MNVTKKNEPARVIMNVTKKIEPARAKTQQNVDVDVRARLRAVATELTNLLTLISDMTTLDQVQYDLDSSLDAISAGLSSIRDITDVGDSLQSSIADSVTLLGKDKRAVANEIKTLDPGKGTTVETRALSGLLDVIGTAANDGDQLNASVVIRNTTSLSGVNDKLKIMMPEGGKGGDVKKIYDIILSPLAQIHAQLFGLINVGAPVAYSAITTMAEQVDSEVDVLIAAINTLPLDILQRQAQEPKAVSKQLIKSANFGRVNKFGNIFNPGMV